MTILSARDIPLRTVKVEFGDGSTRDIAVTQIVTQYANPALFGMEASSLPIGPISGPSPDWSAILPDYDVHETADGRYLAFRIQT